MRLTQTQQRQKQGDRRGSGVIEGRTGGWDACVWLLMSGCLCLVGAAVCCRGCLCLVGVAGCFEAVVAVVSEGEE